MNVGPPIVPEDEPLILNDRTNHPNYPIARLVALPTDAAYEWRSSMKLWGSKTGGMQGKEMACSAMGDRAAVDMPKMWERTVSFQIGSRMACTRARAGCGGSRRKYELGTPSRTRTARALLHHTEALVISRAQHHSAELRLRVGVEGVFDDG